jgi:iron(III) transport system permease protein
VVVALLLLLLGAAIVLPLLVILMGAVVVDHQPTMRILTAVVAKPIFVRALANTLLSGVLVVGLGSLIAVPLAWLTARYDFRGRRMLTTLGLLPLVVPPFVGAIAFQQVLGREGMVNLFLLQRFGLSLPFMEGLRGVVLVQTLHYFPVIVVSTAAALSGIARSLEEAAQMLGASGLRLHRRILVPLALSGYAAGALLTFIRVIDDLGTPLMLDYPMLLAPQAYVRVTTAGLADGEASVICVVLIVLSLGALWLFTRALGRKELTVLGQSGKRPAIVLAAAGTAGAWALAALLLGPALLPQVGVLLLSVSSEWGPTILPSAYTADHYREILWRTPYYVWNTFRYAVLAACLDLGLGTVIAWLLLRGRTRGGAWLHALATVPLAVPGVVLALGYLRIFHGWSLPGLGAPLTSTWLVLVVVYAVARLPYAVRGSRAALQALPPALEEAAQGLGASRARAFARVTVPLVTRGLLVGGLLAFVGSAADLSSTLLLVSRPELGPLSYGVFASMNEAGGRGSGAALGVLLIAIVAAGTWVAARLAFRAAGTTRS